MFTDISVVISDELIILGYNVLKKGVCKMGKNLFEVLKERKRFIKVSVAVLFGTAAVYMAPVCFAMRPVGTDQKHTDDMSSIVKTVSDDEYSSSASEQVKGRGLSVSQVKNRQAEKSHDSTADDRKNFQDLWLAVI